MSTTYLSYLQTILGIENVVMDLVTAPNEVTSNSVNTRATNKPLFLLEKSPSLQSVLTSGPASDLFDKMVAALGWQRHEVEVREVSLENEVGNSAHVLFTALESETQWPQLSNGTKSYHPSELLAKPQLKRAAWELLQPARRSTP